MLFTVRLKAALTMNPFEYYHSMKGSKQHTDSIFDIQLSNALYRVTASFVAFENFRVYCLPILHLSLGRMSVFLSSKTFELAINRMREKGEKSKKDSLFKSLHQRKILAERDICAYLPLTEEDLKLCHCCSSRDRPVLNRINSKRYGRN
jgi:hypothetical protein